MKNKLKLSLVNFQSITNGELEFETGLNFIVGQSNSGKSATFRALKACLSNPSGSQRFIKKDSNIAEVVLEYNNNTINWKRTKKESSYVINGEAYVKTGNSNAFKILEDTGFAKDHNDVIMNIEEELQLPFPYGISKTDLFKLFENIFCVSDSAIILKSAKDHENEVKSDIGLLENEVSKVKNKLEELQKFKAELKLKELINSRDNLISKKEKLIRLNDGRDIIRTALKVSSIKLPEPQNFNEKLSKHDDLTKIKKLVIKVQALHEISQTIKNLIVPENKDIRDYIELSNIQKELKVLNELLSLNFNEKIELAPINLNKYLELKKILKEIEKIKELSKLELPSFTILNKLEEYEKLVQYKNELQKVMTEGKEALDKKKIILKKLEELQNKLKEYKVCPLCHKPLNEEESK